MDGRTAAVVLVILGTVYLSYLIDGYSRWLREQKAQDRQTQRDLEEFDRIIARWDAEAKAEESAPAVTQRSPLVRRGAMSDYLFLTLLAAGAVWIICKTIREAAWTATPEAAKWRKEAAEHARLVEGLKQEKRSARREKWAARLSWMNTVAAAFPAWMFKETRSERAVSYASPALP